MLGLIVLVFVQEALRRYGGMTSFLYKEDEVLPEFHSAYGVRCAPCGYVILFTHKVVVQRQPVYRGTFMLLHPVGPGYPFNTDPRLGFPLVPTKEGKYDTLAANREGTTSKDPFAGMLVLHGSGRRTVLKGGACSKCGGELQIGSAKHMSLPVWEGEMVLPDSPTTRHYYALDVWKVPELD